MNDIKWRLLVSIAKKNGFVLDNDEDCVLIVAAHDAQKKLMNPGAYQYNQTLYGRCPINTGGTKDDCRFFNCELCKYIGGRRALSLGCDQLEFLWHRFIRQVKSCGCIIDLDKEVALISQYDIGREFLIYRKYQSVKMKLVNCK